MTTYALYLESGPQHKKTLAHVLDLLGCVVQGDTTAEAVAAAPDAIRAYRNFLKRHGEKLDEELWRDHFAYRKSERVVAVLAQIRQEALDCIGREFAWGAGSDRAAALQAAYSAYREERFLA